MKKKLKFLIKKLGRFYKKFYYKMCLFRAEITGEYIKNVKQIQCAESKRALIIYITHPFKKNIAQHHPNIREARVMVDVLAECSFLVDVLDYRYKHPIQAGKYDLIIGFGDAYENVFYQADRPTCILYATGAPLSVQAYAEVMRIKSVFDMTGAYFRPVRVFDRTWPCSDILSDAIISVTSGWARSQFEIRHDKVYSVNITSLSDSMALANVSVETKDCKQFVWFGGFGVIHKGLDLCLEVFGKRPDLILHVCGYLEHEPDFMHHYQHFFRLDNIRYHGFVDVRSDKMRTIMENSTFIILPSCSEGTVTSVLTCMQWRCIPVVTPQCGIVYPGSVIVSEPSIESVEKAAIHCLTLSHEERNARMRDAAQWVIDQHNIERYKSSLRDALHDILSFERNMG